MKKGIRLFLIISTSLLLVSGVAYASFLISKIENNARFVTDYELACFCLILEIDLKDMLGHFYNELETQI